MEQGTSRTNLIVGAFILGGIALFTILILFVGGKGEPFARRIDIRSPFRNIGGLLVGAPVRLAGVDIGQVRDISFSTTPGTESVIVTMSIEQRTAERIALNARAQIRQLGLLGDKYVEIIQGNVDLGTVMETQELEGMDPFDIAELYGNFEEILRNVKDASAKVGEAVDLYASPKTASDISTGVADLKAILSEIRTGNGFVHAIIYEDAHKGILADFATTAGNAEKASKYLEDLLREAQSGQGSLHTLIYGKELAQATGDIAKIASDLSDAAHQLREGTNLAHRMFYEEKEGGLGADFAELTENLRTSSQDFKQVSAQLREGKGTIGALIQDDALYQDLRTLFGGAGRSQWAKYIIRSTIEENEKRALKDQK
ncbi:MAG: MlaD family protein [Bdellovibrionota bacterium]